MDENNLLYIKAAVCIIWDMEEGHRNIYPVSNLKNKYPDICIYEDEYHAMKERYSKEELKALAYKCNELFYMSQI